LCPKKQNLFNFKESNFYGNCSVVKRTQCWSMCIKVQQNSRRSSFTKENYSYYRAMQSTTKYATTGCQWDKRESKAAISAKPVLVHTIFHNFIHIFHRFNYNS